MDKLGPLVFKSNEAAFEYACRFMQCDLAEGAFLPALVVDAREMFGASKALARPSDGTQVAVLRVASRDGGFVVAAQTVGANGPELSPGDFVAWQAAEFSSRIAAGSDDPRFGWVGLILGRLKAQWAAEGWVGGERFS